MPTATKSKSSKKNVTVKSKDVTINHWLEMNKDWHDSVREWCGLDNAEGDKAEWEARKIINEITHWCNFINMFCKEIATEYKYHIVGRNLKDSSHHFDVNIFTSPLVIDDIIFAKENPDMDYSKKYPKTKKPRNYNFDCRFDHIGWDGTARITQRLNIILAFVKSVAKNNRFPTVQNQSKMIRKQDIMFFQFGDLLEEADIDWDSYSFDI